MFRITLLLICLIFGNYSVHAVAQEECCVNTMCPYECVRCDGKSQCYDLSDEMGCNNETDNYLQSFSKPPVFVPYVLDVIKAQFRKHKVEMMQNNPQGKVCIKSSNRPKPIMNKNNEHQKEEPPTWQLLMNKLQNEVPTTTTTEAPIWLLLLRKLQTDTEITLPITTSIMTIATPEPTTVPIQRTTQSQWDELFEKLKAKLMLANPPSTPSLSPTPIPSTVSPTRTQAFVTPIVPSIQPPSTPTPPKPAPSTPLPSTQPTSTQPEPTTVPIQRTTQSEWNALFEKLRAKLMLDNPPSTPSLSTTPIPSTVSPTRTQAFVTPFVPSIQPPSTPTPSKPITLTSLPSTQPLSTQPVPTQTESTSQTPSTKSTPTTSSKPTYNITDDIISKVPFAPTTTQPDTKWWQRTVLPPLVQSPQDPTWTPSGRLLQLPVDFTSKAPIAEMSSPSQLPMSTTILPQLKNTFMTIPKPSSTSLSQSPTVSTKLSSFRYSTPAQFTSNVPKSTQSIVKSQANNISTSRPPITSTTSQFTTHLNTNVSSISLVNSFSTSSTVQRQKIVNPSEEFGMITQSPRSVVVYATNSSNELVTEQAIINTDTFNLTDTTVTMNTNEFITNKSPGTTQPFDVTTPLLEATTASFDVKTRTFPKYADVPTTVLPTQETTQFELSVQTVIPTLPQQPSMRMPPTLEKTLIPTTVPPRRPVTVPTTGPRYVLTRIPITVPTTGPRSVLTRRPITVPTTGPSSVLTRIPITVPTTGPSSVLTRRPITVPTIRYTTGPVKLGIPVQTGTAATPWWSETTTGPLSSWERNLTPTTTSSWWNPSPSTQSTFWNPLFGLMQTQTPLSSQQGVVPVSHKTVYLNPGKIKQIPNMANEVVSLKNNDILDKTKNSYNGKIDKQSLSKDTTTQPTIYVAKPNSPVETTLTNVKENAISKSGNEIYSVLPPQTLNTESNFNMLPTRNSMPHDAIPTASSLQINNLFTDTWTAPGLSYDWWNAPFRPTTWYPTGTVPQPTAPSRTVRQFVPRNLISSGQISSWWNHVQNIQVTEPVTSPTFVRGNSNVLNNNVKQVNNIAASIPKVNTQSNSNHLNNGQLKINNQLPDGGSSSNNLNEVKIENNQMSNNQLRCTQISNTDFCKINQPGKHANPSDCKTYYVCDWNRLHHCHCPYGTAFDSKIKICNWSHAVTC